MSFFNSPTVKRVANTSLSFSSLYLFTGIMVNALGPIVGSLYGLFIARKDQCHYITKGHEIAKLYFFPFTEAYSKLTQIPQAPSLEEKSISERVRKS